LVRDRWLEASVRESLERERESLERERERAEDAGGAGLGRPAGGDCQWESACSARVSLDHCCLNIIRESSQSTRPARVAAAAAAAERESACRAISTAPAGATAGRRFIFLVRNPNAAAAAAVAGGGGDEGRGRGGKKIVAVRVILRVY
jgi:hypothetical protein